MSYRVKTKQDQPVFTQAELHYLTLGKGGKSSLLKGSLEFLTLGVPKMQMLKS